MSKVSLDKHVEEILIKRIQKGDKESFSIIYRHYHPHIKSYFLQRNIDAGTCEDLASAVFERSFKGIANFKWQGLSLSSWLYKIARNVLIDFFRSSQRSRIDSYPTQDLEDLPSNGETPEEVALRTETGFFIGNLLATLPKREAKIIYLKFFEGYTNKVIAKLLQISETNVGTIIYRTVGKFRSQIHSSGYK